MPAARPPRRPGKTYQLTGKVVAGLPGSTRDASTYFRVRDRDGHGSVPVALRGRAARPVPRGARDRRRRAQAGRRVRRPAGLAGHEVPVEVHGRQDRAPERAEPRAQACLILALAIGALRHRRLALRRARAAGASGSPPAAARSTRWPACCWSRSRSSRPRSCARTSRFALVAEPLLDDDADLLPADRDVVLAGGLAAAVGAAAGAVVEPDPVPHAPPRCARSRPTRPPCCSASARFFCSLLVFLEIAVRQRADAGRPRASGLNPLLRHPSMMIHPPMLYSGYTLFAIPFAFAVGALITRRLDAEWIRSTRPFTLAAWFFLGIGHRARRALVVLRARLGRLLGLGPGRERVADAVADRHRVPALGDDPGEARDAEGLERLARAGHRRAGDPRHVPRALGDPRARSTRSAPRRSACRSWS